MPKKANRNKKLPIAEFYIGALSFFLVLMFAFAATFFTEDPYIISIVAASPILVLNRVIYLKEKEADRVMRGKLNDLAELAGQLDQSARLLVRRDLELSRANEKLRNLDQMKSDFVSLVTHQLRTPLTGIKWSLSMLLSGEIGELQPDQRLYLMKTYESNERMIALINDLLKADKIEGRTLKFEFVPTQIGNLLDNVIIEVKPLADTKKVSLEIDKDRGIPLIPMDSENIRVVLQNLIENAIKYTPPNGKVTIRVHKAKGGIEIVVSDTGIGIPEEQQKNIFRRFFRAPNAVRTETDGSGLGLYIVDNIVRRHNGSIKFESQENKGTTFTVELPMLEEEQRA